MRRYPTWLCILVIVFVVPLVRAEDRSVSDEAALELIDLVRQALRVPPERDFDMPRIDSERLRRHDTAQVSVTLFNDQAPSITVVRSGQNLAEAAAGAARTIIGLPSSLFYAFDESDGVAVLVEVEVGRRVIWPLPGRGNSFGDFEPGVDSLMLEFAGNPGRNIAPKKVYQNAYEMVVSGLTTREQVLKDIGDEVVVSVDALNRRTTLADPRAWNADAVKLSAIRVVQFAQVNKGAPLLRLRRLLPSVTRLDGSSLERAVIGATDFLQSIRRLVPMPGKADPAPGVLQKYSSIEKGRIPVKRPDPRVQARAMAAFAAAWRLTRKPVYRESANAIRDTLGKLTTTYRGKPCFAGTDGHLPDTRVTAEVALHLLGSGDPGELEKVLVGCGEFLLAMKRKDKPGYHQRYHTIIKEPMDYSSSDTAPATLALYRLGRRLNQDPFVKAALAEATRLVDYRLERHARGKTDIRPDEMVLFAELADVDKRFGQMLNVGTRALLKQQFGVRKSPFPQYVGAFAWFRPNKGFNLSSEFCVECMTMLSAAARHQRRAGGDIAELKQALARASRFLMQLRFRREASFYCPNPIAVDGALRRDLMDPDVLTDDLAGAVLALVGAAELLGPEARYHFPEAAPAEGY